MPLRLVRAATLLVGCLVLAGVAEAQQPPAAPGAETKPAPAPRPRARRPQAPSQPIMVYDARI